MWRQMFLTRNDVLAARTVSWFFEGMTGKHPLPKAACHPRLPRLPPWGPTHQIRDLVLVPPQSVQPGLAHDVPHDHVRVAATGRQQRAAAVVAQAGHCGLRVCAGARDGG